MVSTIYMIPLKPELPVYAHLHLLDLNSTDMLLCVHPPILIDLCLKNHEAFSCQINVLNLHGSVGTKSWLKTSGAHDQDGCNARIPQPFYNTLL